nr:MAG TPA: hypothetical protein [Caudoviricetes sp.]
MIISIVPIIDIFYLFNIIICISLFLMMLIYHIFLAITILFCKNFVK